MQRALVLVTANSLSTSFLAGLLLAGLMPGQSYVTAPADHVTKPGDGAGFLLGVHPRIEGHTQIIDPSFPRGYVLTLTDVAWRCDERLTYTAANGMGRTFSSTTYSLAHSDCSKFQKVFTQNHLTPLSTVFSGKLTFPSLSGRCASTWSNAGAIKFDKPFMFNGVADLLQEWRVSGGTLTNGSTSALAPYEVDGCFGTDSLVKYLYGDSPYAPGSRYLPTPPGEGKVCADSGQTAGTDAYTSIQAEIYANNHPSNLKGLVRVLESRSYGMAKNAAYIGGLTIGGVDEGVEVGGLCNRWYAINTLTIITYIGTTDALGRSPNYLPTDAVLYINGYAGMPIFGQAGWTDSKANFLALTKAVKVVLPAKPDGSYYGHKKVCHLQLYKDEKGGFVGPTGGESVTYNVVERFGLK